MLIDKKIPRNVLSKLLYKSFVEFNMKTGAKVLLLRTDKI